MTKMSVQPFDHQQAPRRELIGLAPGPMVAWNSSNHASLGLGQSLQRGGVIRRQHLPPIHHKAPVDEHLVSRSIGGDADQATQRIVGWHYSGVLQIHRHKVGFRA